MVGTVRAAGGKHTHFPFSAQTRRPHHGRPAFAEYAVKDKMQPDVAETFQTAYGIGGKFGLQFDDDFRRWHQPGLAGDAEFLRIGRMHATYGFYGIPHCG